MAIATTEGSPIEHDEPCRSVEALAVDKEKPYHCLFTERTKELAAERLNSFLPGRDSYPARLASQPQSR